MLDELLGRAGLRERIAELEDELERLEAQHAAEGERRKEAVRERQQSDERANRLEDRIADLEGRLEHARTTESELDFRGVEVLRGDRLRGVLDRLASYRTGPEGAFTAMVHESVPDAVRRALGERTPLVGRAAPCLALTDDAGIVSVALRPALPPGAFATWDETFRLDRSWFVPTGAVAVALVRSDLFAYGEYRDGERHHFEGFASDVKAKHSKGGFSQARFERRRDGQIEDHLDRCRAVLADRAPDRLVVVGERTVLDEVATGAIATAPVDATGAPEAALDDAFDAFWTATLYRI